jgi:hypothetical protein
MNSRRLQYSIPSRAAMPCWLSLTCIKSLLLQLPGLLSGFEQTCLTMSGLYVYYMFICPANQLPAFWQTGWIGLKGIINAFAPAYDRKE